jgi:hypothetical protein
VKVKYAAEDCYGEQEIGNRARGNDCRSFPVPGQHLIVPAKQDRYTSTAGTITASRIDKLCLNAVSLDTFA